MGKWKSEAEAREEIKNLVAEYYHRFKEQKKDFEPGDRVSYASRVFDEKEMLSLTDATLDFWLTTGRFADEFEKKFAEWIGVKHAYLVNSGSSANLLAFMTLTAPELGERQIKRGDEVITVACGFPTTVTPILQYGAVPVFLDVTVPEYNIDVSRLEDALSEKTKAVMIAHTLGNPFNLEVIKKFCDKHHLWLIEDNCDALGSRYTIDGETRFTGTFGDIGTSSFYPPHHMTMGEGGAVYTNNPKLSRLILSFRDWGRDCICPSGHDNFCGHRFSGQYGQLPKGYDHKYTYSHFGYNLKVTDMQAAVGVEQLKKFPSFIEKRKANWAFLKEALSDIEGLILPEAEIRLGKERLFLTHGHLYGVNFDLQRLADEAKDRNCSMALFGHTHKPCQRTVNGVLCINPGSISFPRQDNRRQSYAMFYLDKKGNLRTELRYI